MKKITTIILAISILSAACGGSGAANSVNPAAEKPMTVGALMTEYKQSKDATVKKYTGKTLKITGVATTAPIMPNGTTDDGVLVIGERGGDPFSTMTCFFKQTEKEMFAKVTADEELILEGVFDDSISTALKPCKIAKM